MYFLLHNVHNFENRNSLYYPYVLFSKYILVEKWCKILTLLKYHKISFIKLLGLYFPNIISPVLTYLSTTPLLVLAPFTKAYQIQDCYSSVANKSMTYSVSCKSVWTHTL